MQIFQLITGENPNCAASKWDRKSQLASLRKQKMWRLRKTCSLPSMCFLLPGESPAPFLVNKRAKAPHLSPKWATAAPWCWTSHWEAWELHPQKNPSDWASNFPSNLWAQGSPGWAQQEVGASQALHLYFCLRKTNKYLMALRDRASVCVLSPYINSCFKHLLDKN